ncbi:zinc-dependent alcohol dehydrogenase family protein [Seongchinamella unica]|uniref:zinc-dependent alcohol dehydrogenase family protein n=1 Tax=Seongchinamella unica TaxID=2547392 RepID=UPI001EEE9E7A|nr:zinc-dependent alcohol dehydrogenase family protein [Seongchinamella unica]
MTLNHVSDDLSGLQVVDAPEPEPGPGMLRVRMTKAAVHPSDLNYIRGEYREAIERLIWNLGEERPSFDVERSKLHPQLPCIPGGEGVGVVDACGADVNSTQWLGKRVALFAGPPSGTWQEYVIAAPAQLSPVPEALPDEQAALMMLNPLTALIATRHVLGVEEGQWLLMSAGASAVSKLAAAIGRHYGFRTISLVRGEKMPDQFPEQLGDVVINTESQDLREEVKRVTGGRGVEFALDCVGGSVAEQMIASLTDGGRMLLYGTLAGPSMQLFSRDLMMTNATVGGFYLPGWLAAQTPAKLGEVMGELGRLSASGMFNVSIAAQFPLADAVAAVRASQQSGRSGKILLDFD